jgi:predicted GNAT family acetyltransferase
MGAVEGSNGDLALVLLMNNINLIIYGEGNECEDAIKMAATDLSNSNADVPGVVGPIAIATQFAFEWASQNEKQAIEKMQQKIYMLEKVHPIKYSPGNLRVAGANDLDLVSEWIYQFAESINEKITLETSVSKAQSFIRDSSLFLWHNEQPVSMARKARPTKNGVVVTHVYTPLAFRSNGYASSCVASLSQRLLTEGYQFCTLYTDLSNPTSNHIYTNVGYQPILDSVMYRFS